MKCENCEHYNICVVCHYIHDKCGYYEPTRPRGEWILDAVSPCSISWFRCSYCGYKYEAYKHANFCPNCGADMRKEGEAK